MPLKDSGFDASAVNALARFAKSSREAWGYVDTPGGLRPHIPKNI